MKAKEVELIYNSETTTTKIIINEEVIKKGPLIIKTRNKSLKKYSNDIFILLSNIINRKCFIFKFNGSEKETRILNKAISSFNESQNDVRILFNSNIIIMDYNTYTTQTKFQMIGKDVIPHLIIEKTKGRRLQEWIGSILNDFLDVNNNIVLLFKGSKLDSEDVKNEVDLFNEKHKDKNKYIDLQFEDVKKIDIENKKTILKRIFQDAKENSPFDEFREDGMIKAFENALSPELEVNVLATMSSGKSTLINAMLGHDLLPSKNEACTATIAKIYDNDDMDFFEAKRIDADNNVIDNFKRADLDLINNWNSDEKTSTIEINGRFPEIKEREDMRLVLVDTPGPNNSRNKSHCDATVQAIMGTQLSMVLYVLNATQLSTEDDQILLKMIQESMNAGGRETQDRFIFIANKIDFLDSENDNESVKETLKNIRKYLKKFKIDNPLIIPVSAELAKLIRIKKAGGQLTIKQENDLEDLKDLFNEEDMNMLEHVKEDISRQSYEKLNEKLKNGTEYEKINIRSGISIIEELLDNYVSKYAVPMQIKDAVDCFSTVMARAEAIENMNNVLNKNEDELQGIISKLKDFNNDKDRINKAKEFRERVKKQEYKMSKEAEKEQKKIKIKINDLLDETQKQFKGKSTPEAAEKILNDIETTCYLLFSEIQKILTNSLDSEFNSKIEYLRKEYQSFVEGVLKKAFPDNIDIKNLQMSTVKLPEANNLIKQNSHTSHYEIGQADRATSFWGKCCGSVQDFFSGKDSYTKTEIDMLELYKDFAIQIRTNRDIMLNIFKNFAIENVEVAKDTLLKEMKKINEKVNENLINLDSASKSKKVKEKLIEINNNNLKWFENFKQELNEKIINI